VSSARAEILAAIRAARGAQPATDAARRAAADAHLAARAVSPRPAAAGDLAAAFRARAAVLGMSCDEARTPADIPECVARYLRAGALPLHAACWPRFADLPWSASGIGIEARAACDGDAVGITGAYCAMAETGTLVMLSGPDSPLLTSMLPETHIVILERERMVRAMEEVWQLLRTEHGTLPRAVHFISGPSRTADIEQTVTLGAHGPGRVHVILLG